MEEDSNQLVLNVGADAALRLASPNSISEAYNISSTGPGTVGENIVVEAFGSRQQFNDVTSIVGDFGSGNDQVRILPSVGQYGSVSVDLHGGDGADQMVNESSHIGVTFRGDAGNDRLFGSAAGDVFLGGAGNDLLAGGAGADILRGGVGDDQLNWQRGRGTDLEISGGDGTDTLIVTGTNEAEQFTVPNASGNVLVTVAGPATESMRASGIEALDIDAQGGADSVTLFTTTLSSLGITQVGLDLSQTPGEKAFLNDGAVDTITVIGSDAAETITLNPNHDPNNSNNDAVITTAGLSIGLIRPGKLEDVVQIYGQGGNNTLEVVGPNFGDVSSAKKINQIHLFGESGNDTFRLPIGGATFDESAAGDDHGILTVTSGDSTDVTLTGDRISNGSETSSYSNLATVGVEANTPIALTVQSTHSRPTTVTLQGTMHVDSTVGSLNVDLVAAAQAQFEATSGAVNVTGTMANNQIVQIGTGLLASIGGPVSVADVGSLVYDNSLDGPNRIFDLTGSSLSGGSVASSWTHTGSTQMELRTGLGDDIVNVTVNPSQVAIVGHGDQDEDHVNVTMNGKPGLASPTPGTVTTRDADTVHFENNANALTTDWRLDQGRLQGDDQLLLDAATADHPLPTPRLASGPTPLSVETARNFRLSGITMTSIHLSGSSFLRTGHTCISLTTRRSRETTTSLSWTSSYPRRRTFQTPR
jgi:hypothetical protein